MSDPNIAITLVVAVARNGVIGEHNGLPWKLPTELKRFREITIGHPCVMGRVTWQGLKGPLKGRDNIVMTRGPAISTEGVITAGSLEAALAEGRRLARLRGAREVMVIGGGAIYAQALPLANRMYLTRVDMDVAGDTYFPEIVPAQWRGIGSEPHLPGQGDTCGYVIHTLERIG